MSKVFILVTIDTECDKSKDWSIPHPITYNNIHEGVPKVLSPLCEQYNIRPTYLLSPEILNNEGCMAVLSGQKNTELGTHLHAEFIPPLEVKNPTSTSITQIELSREIEEQKLKNLTELFKLKIGTYPKSFRCGRYGMSAHTLSILDELGYSVDSSVMPYRKYIFNGKYVDYWNASLQPYHPSADNPIKEGKMSILEVPLTSITSLVYKHPEWLIKRINPNKSDIKNKVLARAGLKDNGHHYLAPFRLSFPQMKKLTEFMVDKFSDNKSIFLNMTFHSNELYPNAGPYTKNWAEIENVRRNMAEYFEYLYANYDTESIGLGDVPSRL